MNVTRRTVLKGAGGGLIASGFLAALASNEVWAADAKSNVKVGMCDWNLGGTCNPDLIPKAKEAHLDAIQVSIGTVSKEIPLRDPAFRNKYLELGKQHGIKFCSVAAGRILNNIALSTEPAIGDLLPGRHRGRKGFRLLLYFAGLFR